MPSLLTIFPEPKNLLALEPEELAAILVEIIPSISQKSGFLSNSFLEQLSPIHDGGYPPATHAQVAVALAEAMSWLETQGIIVRNPNQPAEWYLLTKRGRELKSRTDLETFRKGRALPFDRLQPSWQTKFITCFCEVITIRLFSKHSRR